MMFKNICVFKRQTVHDQSKKNAKINDAFFVFLYSADINQKMREKNIMKLSKMNCSSHFSKE